MGKTGQRAGAGGRWAEGERKIPGVARRCLSGACLLLSGRLGSTSPMVRAQRVMLWGGRPRSVTQRPTAPLPPISPLPLPFALFSPSPAAPLFGSASAIRTPDLSPSSSRPFPWDSRSPTVRLRRGEERDTGAQRLLFFFGLLRGGQPPSSHASNRPPDRGKQRVAPAGLPCSESISLSVRSEKKK